MLCLKRASLEKASERTSRLKRKQSRASRLLLSLSTSRVKLLIKLGSLLKLPKGRSSMAGGRPRTKSYSPEEMIELGEEMLDWFDDNPKALHVSDFYSGVKGIRSKDWDTMIRCPEFSVYHELAIKKVRKNYLDGTVNGSIAHRFLRIYFPELKQEEDETARFNAGLKAQEQKPPHDAVVETLLDTIKSLKTKENA